MYTYEGSIKILVQKREDEMIKVTVTDTGIGMNE
jgi:sensor histidine kinase YesM